MWLGGNVVIAPASPSETTRLSVRGAVVTHDIPADSIAVGNPCHVIAEVPDDWTPEERAAAEVGRFAALANCHGETGIQEKGTMQ